MSAIEIWTLSEDVVDIVARFDSLPWWAWLRRARLRSRMREAIRIADDVCMGPAVRAMVGSRL